MARMRETREARGGLLNTATGGKDAADEDPLRMPDPFDPVKREVERAGLRLARLRGGRLATILSPLLRGKTGTGRTGTVEGGGGATSSLTTTE